MIILDWLIMFGKVLLLLVYGLLVVPSAVAYSWLWPKREKIQNRFWRWAYTAPLIPLVGLAYIVGSFEELYEEILKF